MHRRRQGAWGNGAHGCLHMVRESLKKHFYCVIISAITDRLSFFFWCADLGLERDLGATQKTVNFLHRVRSLSSSDFFGLSGYNCQIFGFMLKPIARALQTNIDIRFI